MPAAPKPENENERLEAKGSPFGGRSSIRVLATRITKILCEERVDRWHLVAPPAVEEQLVEILDDPVQLRRRRIGLGELVAVAEGCESSVSGSSSWENTGGSE